MKGNLKRMCVALAAAAGLTFAYTAPAAAYSDGAAQQEQAVEAEEEGLWPLEEQEPEESEYTPFSIPGNGGACGRCGRWRHVKAVSDRTDKKTGTHFYIVVDRSGSTENVYMLSLVDENDLAEFIETADSGGDADALEIAEPALDLETSADEEAGDGQEDDADGEKQGEGTGKGGSILVILILGVCAAGICFCLKTARARKEPDSADEEPVEFYNDYEECREDSSENEE